MRVDTPDIQDKIQFVVDEVKNTSFKEKTHEEKVNDFLDAILSFKKNLNSRVSKMYKLIEKMESLTWYTDVSKDDLMKLNELIAAARDLHSILIRRYVSFNTPLIRKKGIAIEELKAFKHSIDDFRETYEDLESIFFFLPKYSEFIETTKQFSQL